MSNNINGVINIFKEKGFTSHDVVAKLRGILKTKKIGHTGTLDPDAEGVLPVCIGNATKLCDLIMDKTKTYEAELVLGIKTDTQDMSGQIIEKYDNKIEIDNEIIVSIIKSFEGDYAQIPPMYSAIKINGRKLYDLAREGIEVERKARNIHIYSIDILDIKLPIIKMRVNCSKGTYIRTLCNDIGDKLGVYGCMGYLLRTQTGIFNLENSNKLADVEKIVNEDRLFQSGILINTDEILDSYPKLKVKDDYEKFLYNGNPLTASMIENDTLISEEEKMYRIYCKDKFMAVYKSANGGNLLKVEKMFM